MIEIRGIVSARPSGREIGRRGYLHAMIYLAPWWIVGSEEDEHPEPLLVHMDMDWDLAGAWIETDPGQPVRAMAERIELGPEGPDALCTDIDWRYGAD